MIKIHILLINNEFSKFMISKLIMIVNYFRNRSLIANINKILYENKFDRKLDLSHLKRIK